MNTTRLTFGQLLKLASLSNLLRLTMRYHTRLREQWALDHPSAPFMVSTAERRYPELAARYQRVLAFIRGPVLKRRLQLSAQDQQVPYRPGANILVREFETLANSEIAYNLAFTGKCFCEALGVPARVVKTDRSYQVRADTDAFGVAILKYHPGVPVGMLHQFCQDGNMNFSGMFWWVPAITPSRFFLNPLLRCLNTPDVMDNARDLLFNPDENQVSEGASIG